MKNAIYIPQIFEFDELNCTCGTILEVIKPFSEKLKILPYKIRFHIVLNKFKFTLTNFIFYYSFIFMFKDNKLKIST